MQTGAAGQRCPLDAVRPRVSPDAFLGGFEGGNEVMFSIHGGSIAHSYVFVNTHNHITMLLQTALEGGTVRGS